MGKGEGGGGRGFTTDVGQDRMGQSATGHGDVRVPASAGDTGPRPSCCGGLDSLRAGADMGPSLGSGARSEGRMKRARLDAMAGHGVRLSSRVASIDPVLLNL